MAWSSLTVDSNLPEKKEQKKPGKSGDKGLLNAEEALIAQWLCAKLSVSLMLPHLRLIETLWGRF